jgi:NAD+ diphosphatase
MKGLFVPSISRPDMEMKPAWWFVFKERKLLVHADGDRVTIPLLTDVNGLNLPLIRNIFLGTLDGTGCYAGELAASASARSDMELLSLRDLHDRIDRDLHQVAFRAIHMLEWEETDQYCGRCGAKNKPKQEERAKQCPVCGLVSFPRISPAVIVLIERGKKVLLARAARFQGDWYSVLAGFVEAGETLEDVIHREIREETGIEVKDIRYFGSQPWPFPDSLMIAFTAKYAGGDIKIDGTEIVDAAWFDFDKLPRVPGRVSIARALIDWFLEKNQKRRRC